MSNISDLDALMTDLDSARRSTGSGLGQTRVYPSGTQVSHSFNISKNTITMTDRTSSNRNERDQDSPVSQGRDRDRSEGAGSPLISRPKSPGSLRKLHPDTRSPRQANTSGATQELDDLMASLNDFKVTNENINTTSTTSRTSSSTNQFATDSSTNYRAAPRAGSAGPGAINDPWIKNGNNGAYSPTLGERERNSLERDQTDRAGANSRASDLSDNTCAGCDKAVNGQVVTALGKVWHTECFKCTHCKSALRTQPFFEKSGKAYCENDYYQLFAMKCARCKGPIKDTCFTALDQTWHPECFCCAQCSQEFGESSFHERDGKPFCEQCYLNTFAPQCAGCQKPISSTYLTALDKQWHRDCFVCSDCRKPFESGSFFDLEGRPYCEQHYHSNRGSVCGTCGQPISGRCITAMGKKFHPDHFVCSYCVRPLNKGTFKEHANKPWCHNCFERLYGSKKGEAGSVDDGSDM